MTKNATYFDKHVSSRKCIFCSVLPKHTTLEWRLLKEEMRQDSSGDKDEDDDDNRVKGASGYPNVKKVLMIFADVESKSRLKVINREVNMAVPTATKYLDWARLPRQSSPSITRIIRPTYRPLHGRLWWSILLYERSDCARSSWTVATGSISSTLTF